MKGARRLRDGEDRANPRERIARRISAIYYSSAAWKVKDPAGTDLVGSLMFALKYMDDAQIASVCQNLWEMVPWSRKGGRDVPPAA